MELFKRREYKKVELYEGKVFIGYQQYFEVRDIWKGEVTLLEMAGDAHRVERGPRAAIERLLQMVVDGYQSMEDAMRYMEEEYPDPRIRVVAIWPDDPDYNEFVQKHDVDYSTCIYDIETGEVYDEEVQQ